MKYLFPLILVFQVSCESIFAQNTYSLHWPKEAVVTGIGFTTGISGLAIGRKIVPLTLAEIALLDRKNIMPMDRKAANWHSSSANKASDLLFYAATAAPLLFLADQRAKKEISTISVMYMEAMTLAGGLTLLTKNLATRTRPYAYNPDYPVSLKQRRDARRSFFSGHTSSTATSCFFAAKVWSDNHPDSRWKPLVWATAVSIPAVTGYLRLRAGKHFFTDVLTGYVVGAAIGCLVPILHKKAGG